MSVCCECCVLSDRDLCDELITCPEESYRLWCVAVCDLETSSMRSQTSIVTELKNRRYITGCICCMPLIVTVNTTAECLRTDYNIQIFPGGKDLTSGEFSLGQTIPI